MTKKQFGLLLTQLTALAATYSLAFYTAVVNAFKPISEKYGINFNPAPAPVDATPTTPSMPATDAANDIARFVIGGVYGGDNHCLFKKFRIIDRSKNTIIAQQLDFRFASDRFYFPQRFKVNISECENSERFNCDSDAWQNNQVYASSIVELPVNAPEMPAEPDNPASLTRGAIECTIRNNLVHYLGSKAFQVNLYTKSFATTIAQLVSISRNIRKKKEKLQYVIPDEERKQLEFDIVQREYQFRRKLREAKEDFRNIKKSLDALLAEKPYSFSHLVDLISPAAPAIATYIALQIKNTARDVLKCVPADYADDLDPAPATPATPSTPVKVDAPPTPAQPAPAKPSTPSTDAANDKFQGLTFLPIARVMVQAITQKLAELDKNITIDFHDTFAVVVNFDKKAGRNFRVKFPTNSGSEDDTLAKFALADYKWWTMTNAEIKTLTKENSAAGMVVCTAKTFYTKAAQYLGLMKISPAIERASDPVRTGLCLPGFEEKHPTTNLPPRPVIPAITGDTDAAPDVDTPTERGKCMHMSVVDWPDAFDAIQQLAPAKYSVKVYGDSSILYAADNGYGFEILTIGGADAIVGKTMLIGKQIQRVTFGRVENGLLQVASATDKLISFSKGFPSVAKKQDYLDWMGLPANDTFAPAELGKPFELARASRTIKEKRWRETIEVTQYSFSDAAKKFFKGNGKILADSQFLFHTASDVVKYIVIEDAPFNNGGTEDSLALVPGDTKGSLVNPNGGEPFIEGVEHINFCTGGVTALEYIDLPIFASGKRITKIEFIPAIKSTRRA